MFCLDFSAKLDFDILFLFCHFFISQIFIGISFIVKQEYVNVTEVVFFFQKFQLCVKEPEKTIAPGLEVNAVVEYYTEKEEDCHDHLVLLVNGITEKVPLYGYVTSSNIIAANHLFEIFYIEKVLLSDLLIFRDNV